MRSQRMIQLHNTAELRGIQRGDIQPLFFQRLPQLVDLVVRDIEKADVRIALQYHRQRRRTRLLFEKEITFELICMKASCELERNACARRRSDDDMHRLRMDALMRRKAIQQFRLYVDVAQRGEKLFAEDCGDHAVRRAAENGKADLLFH